MQVIFQFVHLQLNHLKTELLVFSVNQAVPQNINIQLGLLSLTPTKAAKNLGVMMTKFISLSMRLPPRSCQFTLYNIWKNRSYLTQYAKKNLV